MNVERRARSIWSNVNTKRVAELTKQGRMHAAGLKAFEARDPKRLGIYALEQRQKDQQLDAALEAKLRKNKNRNSQEKRQLIEDDDAACGPLRPLRPRR